MKTMEKKKDTKPKQLSLGFIGVGWIGLNRLKTLLEKGNISVCAVADKEPKSMQCAMELAPDAVPCNSLDEMLEEPLDGIVIATPSALHAQQTIETLNRGIAVFCQKPLGRNTSEIRSILDIARKNNCLLGVDFSYRYLAATQMLRTLINNNDLGEIYAVETVFHNAYGPDKPWFFEKRLSGGGCLIDLGVHLVDLVLWLFPDTSIGDIQGKLYRDGKLISRHSDSVETYASVNFDLDSSIDVRVTCSWNISAGQDALISAVFWGTRGSAVLRNVNGSFYDFTLEKNVGTHREILVSPPDQWGGKAIEDWSNLLSVNKGYCKEIENVIRVHEIIDAAYSNTI